MRFFTLLIGIIFIPMSHAQNITNTNLSPLYDSLVDSLIVDAEKILKVKAPNEKPKILVAPREKIKELYCEGLTKCNVVAVTNRETGEIIVSEGFSPNNAISVSILFHELVHWFQVKHKMFISETDCLNWSNAEMHAYTAQSVWLESLGLKGFKVPDLTTQCY
jgi:hypothetical protein